MRRRIAMKDDFEDEIEDLFAKPLSAEELKAEARDRRQENIDLNLILGCPIDFPPSEAMIQYEGKPLRHLLTASERMEMKRTLPGRLIRPFADEKVLK